jgi:hypothetical protein
MQKRNPYEDLAVTRHMYYTLLDRSHTNDYLAHAIDNRDRATATELVHLPRNRAFHLYTGLVFKLCVLALTATLIAVSISSITTGGASLGLSLALLQNYHNLIMLASWASLAIGALGALVVGKSACSSIRSAYLCEDARSNGLVAKEPAVYFVPVTADSATPAYSGPSHSA